MVVKYKNPDSGSFSFKSRINVYLRTSLFQLPAMCPLVSSARRIKRFLTIASAYLGGVRRHTLLYRATFWTQRAFGPATGMDLAYFHHNLIRFWRNLDSIWASLTLKLNLILNIQTDMRPIVRARGRPKLYKSNLFSLIILPRPPLCVPSRLRRAISCARVTVCVVLPRSIVNSRIF